jgi:hypothetical protein
VKNQKSNQNASSEVKGQIWFTIYIIDSQFVLESAEMCTQHWKVIQNFMHELTKKLQK